MKETFHVNATTKPFLLQLAPLQKTVFLERTPTPQRRHLVRTVLRDITAFQKMLQQEIQSLATTSVQGGTTVLLGLV